MALPTIAISTGDPAGIGPEIALKAALHAEVRAVCRPLLVGDRGALELHAKASGLTEALSKVDLLERMQFPPGELRLGQVSAAHGLAAIDSAAAAIKTALEGK